MSSKTTPPGGRTPDTAPISFSIWEGSKTNPYSETSAGSPGNSARMRVCVTPPAMRNRFASPTSPHARHNTSIQPRMLFIAAAAVLYAAAVAMKAIRFRSSFADRA